MANETLGLEITELRLGLPGDSSSSAEKNGKKRVFSEIVEDENSTSSDGKSEMKNRVVGWPPICSFRKKNHVNDKKGPEIAKFYVKVSMDGAPFLRKIDLNVYKGYTDLSLAFEKLFDCFGIGACPWKESKGSEYIQIYQDKDGDWMLVGDVPWEMFIESCRRLRIMRRSDANRFELPATRETRADPEG